MNKLIGFFQRAAMRMAAMLRPVVDAADTWVAQQSPKLAANVHLQRLLSVKWHIEFWKPVVGWLTVVTWKRLIVVLILMLVIGGVVSSCIESMFSATRHVTVDEKSSPRSRSKERSVTVSNDGMVITDKKTGKTVRVSFDGVVTSDKEDDEPKTEVNASGVVIEDPETGKRVRFGPEGATEIAANGVKAVPAAPPAPPALPAQPVPPAQPPVAEKAKSKAELAIDAVQVIRNPDGSASVVAGPVNIRLPKGVSAADLEQAKQDVQTSVADMREEQARIKAEIDAARADLETRADAAQADARAREAADEAAHDESGKKSNQRVITVNKPQSFSDVIMPMLTVLIFVAILSKVVLNTRSKAAAKVAQARQETERESLERQLVEAKLTTMQAQVEPHFLFNTLGSVEYLIEVDPKRAAQMQRHLIEYLRAAMPHMRDTRSNMGRESKLISSFLEILSFRMEERLTFSVDIPVGLHSAEFPPMMLLSLVENCIKHGLEPKPDGGRVDVKAEVIDARLRVTVADTGLGYRPGKAATSGTGVGLANIRERLKVLYPGMATLDMRSNLPVGTLAIIELPYKVNSDLKT